MSCVFEPGHYIVVRFTDGDRVEGLLARVAFREEPWLMIVREYHQFGSSSAVSTLMPETDLGDLLYFATFERMALNETPYPDQREWCEARRGQLARLQLGQALMEGVRKL